MKKLTFLILVFLFYLFTPGRACAENEFITDSHVEYFIEENGNTKVTHTITLENTLPTIYAKSYSLLLDNVSLKNVSATESGQNLEVSENKEGATTTIDINFPNALVGKGNQRVFQVVFEVEGLAEKSGEVWDITIPKLNKPDAYRNYSVSVSVPRSFGLEAYSSPEPLSRNQEDNRQILNYNKGSLSETGISLAFGEFQVFSFVINYHLENPLSKTTETTIPLPPDTAFQKVFYTQINPNPKNISLDSDGNWLAKYMLSSRQRLDIIATGTVQIYSKEREFIIPTNETLSQNLRSSEFWQVDDPEIVKIANNLTNAKSIYDYVVSTLSYNFERVKPNVQRLGAKSALNSPNDAICMEFTDLFIALARAKGIPAREVNGYAYTENPSVQPLSMVADVLHSWPEYWDNKRKVWIPVDPTWGDTTGGLDFFSKFDLRHFTFVIHGMDPSKPYAPGSYKLGPNPQKDIFINFGKLPEIRTANISLKVKNKRYVPFTKSVISLELTNLGPIAIYNTVPKVFFNGTETALPAISFMAPLTTKEFEVEIPFSFLGVKTPEKVNVSVLGENISIPSFKKSVIISSLIALFVILAILTFLSLVYLKRGKINKALKSFLAKLNELKKTNIFRGKKN
jgi:transglutaminase-like putative cysteine protease